MGGRQTYLERKISSSFPLSHLNWQTRQAIRFGGDKRKCTQIESSFGPTQQVSFFPHSKEHNISKIRPPALLGNNFFIIISRFRQENLLLHYTTREPDSQHPKIGLQTSLSLSFALSFLWPVQFSLSAKKVVFFLSWANEKEQQPLFIYI